MTCLFFSYFILYISFGGVSSYLAVSSAGIHLKIIFVLKKNQKVLHYKGFVDGGRFFLESLLFWATCISFSCFPHMGHMEQQKLNYENLIEWTNALKYIPILVP